MTHPVKAPKKLIEVALPLDAINGRKQRLTQKDPKGVSRIFGKRDKD